MFFSFDPSNIIEVLSAVTVTTFPSRRLYPPESGIGELHLCVRGERRFYAILHIPGFYVPSSAVDRELKTHCIVFRYRPGAVLPHREPCPLFERFSLPMRVFGSPALFPETVSLFHKTRHAEGEAKTEFLRDLLYLIHYQSWENRLLIEFPSAPLISILNRLLTEYREPIKIADLADRHLLTPNYLSNLFRKYTGKTIKEVLDLVRAANAREALPSSESVSKIAADYGFSCKTSMDQIFLRLFGCLPKDCVTPYRARYQVLRLLFSTKK